MTGIHTLRATEQAIGERLRGMDINTEAMWAVSNVYRASASIRNHLERTVLRDTGLTWTGFVVLWVVWIWGESETRVVAAESGISKGTLTGVVKTLESYRYVKRATHATDARRVLLSLTRTGERLMRDLFPKFNAQETHVVASLTSKQRKDLAASLRLVIEKLEADG